MKNLQIIPILIGLLVLLANALFATDKYTETMLRNIDGVYKAQSVEEYQVFANTFSRIGEAEKTKWEPFYYEAYSYVMISTKETEATRKDASLDSALKALERAKALESSESEIVTLEGFIHMMRVTVDPASRGQRYSALAFQYFNKAIGLNQNNPRALSLLAQMEYGTAQFFGSPTTSACETAARALDKFATIETSNPLAPSWGKAMTEAFKKRCQ